VCEVSDINNVTIVGRLGADPELKQAGGSQVCKMRVATSRKWKDKNTGEMTEQTQWHSIDVWGPQAESCAKFLTKGRQVGVVGEIQYSKVGEGSDAKFFTTIRARDVQFLGSGKGSGDTAPSDGPDIYVPSSQPDDNLGF
jgi:single-strand DNA-binding protein